MSHPVYAIDLFTSNLKAFMDKHDKAKTLVVCSGGLDSTVLAYDEVRSGNVVGLFAVDYGQRHNVELVYAQATASRLGVPFFLAPFGDFGKLLKGSSQTDKSVPVPHGHYEDASMRATVVPNRNMLLLAAAAAVAISHGAHRIAYAAHAGDHAVYPDCRPEFVGALQGALYVCDYEPVFLVAPYVHNTKADIVKKGVELSVPFNQTWSCYEGLDMHCGRCGTCVERQEAFKLTETTDPTRYASNT